MNNIIYAGKCKRAVGSKYFEIYIPYAKGEVATDAGDFAFARGQILVAPPNTRYRVRGGSDDDLLIRLDNALLPRTGLRVLEDDKNSGLARAAEQAADYFGGDNARKDVVLSALANLMAAYITAAGECKRFSPIVATVRGEIDKKLSDVTFSLEDYLKTLPLNYDYVRKLFKKETGATPHEYLISARMELARNLITSGLSNRFSNYTVSQIAEACGFSEPLYFSRVFKKYFGVAPSAYSKQ